MEIIIKTKQKFNPHFSFLHHEDRLFPYYKFILDAINKGVYTPSQDVEDRGEGVVGGEEGVVGGVADTELPENGDDKAESADTKKDWNKLLAEASDDESDNEGAELHPLLMGSSSKPKVPLVSKKFKSGGFKNIAMTINAAPAVKDATANSE